MKQEIRVRRIYEESRAPRAPWIVLGCCAGARSSVAEKRAAFLKLVERPRVDSKPEVRPLTANGLRLVVEHISLSVEGTQRVTALLIKSLGSTGRQPVVIQLHGTGGNKEQLRPRLTTLAHRGFVAVAIDGRYHGERAGNAPGLSTPVYNRDFDSYKTGREHPFFYDTVLDVMRLIDYLETQTGR